MKNLIHHAILLTTLFVACFWLTDAWDAAGAPHMSDYFVYIGTYGGPKSQGIYVFKFAAASGKLTPLGLAAKATMPSFLAIHPNHRYLYAENQIIDYEGQKSGSVSAFSIDRKTGVLTLLNVVASGAGNPSHLIVDRTGKYVLVDNFGTFEDQAGSVAAFPILSDGRLGKATSTMPQTGHSIDPKRQLFAHPHSIYVSLDNRFVVSPDLGTDQVYVYRFDAGTLTPTDPPTVTFPPGTQPRHFAFHPNGKFAYLIGEESSTLTALSYDAAHGALDPLETISTLRGDYKGKNSTAEVFIHPSGRFLYVSNRGHDSIAVFAIDAAKGTPTLIEFVPTQGKKPRSFGIDPTGSYLIAGNQDSDTLVVFRIDAETGRLTPTGEIVDVPSPACVMFEPME